MTPAVAAYVRDRLGPFTEEADHTRHAGAVVAVRDRTGQRWMVKTVPTHRTFGNEVRAYRRWVPRFADQAPRLLGSHRGLRTLVIEWLPGEVGWTFARADHRDAGRLLRRIHGAVPARPPHGQRTLADATRRTLAVALARMPDHRGVVDGDTLLRLRSSVDELDRFSQLPLVPTHGDFGGHNWLRGGGDLRVIDFSTADWRPAVHDLARLYAGPWWERPDLADAFFDGYGRAITGEELAAVRLQLPVFALNVLTLGMQSGDEELVRRGRGRLQRSMAGHDFTRRAPLLRRTARRAWTAMSS